MRAAALGSRYFWASAFTVSEAASRTQTIAVHPDPTVRITVDTAGAITWAGQTVGITETLATVAGAITWAGATDITLTVSGPPAALEYGWDEVGRFWTSATSETGDYPAASDTLSETGVLLRDLQPAAGATITVTVAGAITWTGQSVGLRTTITPTAERSPGTAK